MHRRLIDTAGASGNDRALGVRGELTHGFGVREERVVHVARPHDRKTPSVQQADVAASVQHSRGCHSKPLLEPLRVRCVRTAHHPNGATTPALNCLTQQKAPRQQTLHLIDIRDGRTLLQQPVGAAVQEVRRLVPRLA